MAVNSMRLTPRGGAFSLLKNNIALPNVAPSAKDLKVFDDRFSSLTPRKNVIDVKVRTVLWGRPTKLTASTIPHQNQSPQTMIDVPRCLM